MITVNSVLGPIETSALGTTLAHEHLLVASSPRCRDKRYENGK